MVVGKHVGRLMGALGGRVGAYRDALENDADLKDAIVRNIFRGEKPDDEEFMGYCIALRGQAKDFMEKHAKAEGETA